MKYYILMIAAVMMAACGNDDDLSGQTAGHSTRITFDIQGDFTLSTHDFTRALTADGKEMTDVWVLDYMDGNLVQQIHQDDNTADDFGTPTLSLAIGTHHIYFIASRGTSPVLNTTDYTLTFGRVLDTFWRDYAITITEGTSSGSRAVVLDRVVTKLKTVFTDAIPSGAATFNITPTSWYYSFNYQTGEPCNVTASRRVTINIPSSEIGVVNEAVSLFSFSSSTEWTTDVAVDCKTNGNSILGSATIAAAPFVRNRVSEYTGPLFTAGGGMTLSLNTDWLTTHTGTW